MSGTLVITGASRGIGAATALAGASAGYAVCVNFQGRRDRAEDVVAQIEGIGGKALAVQADVGRAADVERLFQQAEEELGPITGLVNNAGITGPLSRLDETSAADIARTVEVNLTGALLCAAEAVRRMSTRQGGGGGAIVNVSSAAARIGGANEWVDYAATKGGLDSMTVGLAVEVASDGIRVNGVRPGLIETEIHAAAGALDRLGTIAPTIPMQRAGQPEEVAETILWLLSEKASYVSGAIVDVAGGR